MRRNWIRKSTLLLSLAAGLVFTTGIQAKADNEIMVDPVVIDFPEDAHVAIGEDINDLLPLIKVNQVLSKGVYTVADLPTDEIISSDATRNKFFVARKATDSLSGFSTNKDDEILKGYEYYIEFYYRAAAGYSISNSVDTSHALVNSEPVYQLSLSGDGNGDIYRKAAIILSPADWGNISLDLSGKSGIAQLKTRSSGEVLQRTLRQIERGNVNGISCDNSVNKITKVDLDKDGTADIRINLTDTNNLDLRVEKVSGASVTEGKYVFTIEKADMPYNGEGICCNKSVYSSVTINLGAVDISQAKVEAIADQTYTGSAITPEIKVTLNGAQLKSGTDYAAAFSNNIEAGTAAVTIEGKGDYKGSLKASFVIKKTAEQLQKEQQQQQQPTVTDPGKDDGQKGDDGVEIEKIVLPKAAFKSCKAKAGRRIAVKVKEIDAADGYEIAYSTHNKFKKKVKTIKTEKLSATIKKLKKGKVYYVRVRAYVEEDGKVITGKWSAAKRIKVKK